MPNLQSSNASSTLSGLTISDTECLTLLEKTTVALGQAAMLLDSIMSAQSGTIPKLFMAPLSRDLEQKAKQNLLALRDLERFVVDLKQKNESQSF